MRLVIRPVQDTQRELAITHRLVAAIAEELWRHYGGDGGLNWIEAELHLERLTGRAREDLPGAGASSVSPAAGGSLVAQVADGRCRRRAGDGPELPIRRGRARSGSAGREAALPGRHAFEAGGRIPEPAPSGADGESGVKTQ